MLHIEYIEEAQIICFAISYNSAAGETAPLPIAENEKLLRNLETSHVSIYSQKTINRTNRWTRWDSTSLSHLVEVSYFSSVNDLIEKALEGFTRDESNIFFFSKNEPHSYMF